MKKGISLIVLVITIVISLILLSVVVLNFSDDNLISKATEVSFKSTTKAYEDALMVYISNRKMELASNGTKYNSLSLFANSTMAWDDTNRNITVGIKSGIKAIIPNIKDGDIAKAPDNIGFSVINGQLVYVGATTEQQGWLDSISIASSLPPIGSYNNPPVPTGFYYVGGDWNSGFVISDNAADTDRGTSSTSCIGNQYVWIPVDASMVEYKKWTTLGISGSSCQDDSGNIPVSNVSEKIRAAGGFYIGRYEAKFEYNGGNIRAASKKSSNMTSITDWSGSRNNSYDGYVWNYITYQDAATYASQVSQKYNYDSSVKTGLMTGAMWDTTMRWIYNSGKLINDSRNWGNYNNSVSPANISQKGSLQVSGFTDFWKAHNIFDLAGNLYEFTSETYNTSNFIVRGGSYNNAGDVNSAGYRSTSTDKDRTIGFRIALFI